jgi:hypothetical protein
VKYSVIVYELQDLANRNLSWKRRVKLLHELNQLASTKRGLV